MICVIEQTKLQFSFFSFSTILWIQIIRSLPCQTLCSTGLAMPGVNLDFLPVSAAPEALDSPDTACAESGLEEVIGDLLVQEDVDEEQFWKKKFESALRCAVGEIHCDLQAFGKRVDARLLEAAAQVAPLAEAFARLQEENARLRIQQERLVRQVEALCQMMGLKDLLLHEVPSKESSPSNSCDTQTPSSGLPNVSNDLPNLPSDLPSCNPQDAALKSPPDASSSALEDSPSVSSQNQASPALDMSSSESQEPLSCPQDSDQIPGETLTLQNIEPSPIPHPPTFATRRSLSAPSLMATISCDDDAMVLLSVNAPELCK